MTTVTTEHVALLRATDNENAAIHMDGGHVSVYMLDHNAETSVCGYGEVNWIWTDQEIADWINDRIEDAQW